MMRRHSKRTNKPPAARRRRCAGFLYVAVLFTALLVMAAVTAALSISTSNLRGESNRTSREEAMRFVESEIHRLAAIMKTSSAWRSEETSGVFSDWHGITLDGVDITGDSQVRHRFTDADGDLADDDFDPVELTVHATVGDSQAAVTVQLEPDPQPLDLLAYAVTATDDLQFEDGGAISAERPVQVFDDCKTSTTGYLTTPQLECSGNVQMVLRGDLAESSVTAPTRDVVAKYVSMGTEIPLAAIPESGGNLLIEDRVLTPTDNPFGATDAAGIYWLDAGGKRVIISHCRIRATLAIDNPSEVVIRGGIVWEYPTKPDVILATNDHILFDLVDVTLEEASRGVNFNPPTSPYRQTLSNLTTTDVYPSGLRGIIYSTRNVRFDPLNTGDQLRIIGAVIGRNVRVDTTLSINQLDAVLSDPPQGLADPTPMRFVRGTMRRIPSP